jgi:hypothetical protein
MSGQLFKIGAACGAIVLGAVVVGSQLSTGGGFANLVSKATDEDKSGAIESADADAARGKQDDEEAEDTDESAADEEASDEEVASDESEDAEGSEGDEIAADEVDESSEGDAGNSDQQQADAGSANNQDGDVIYNGRPVEPGSDD